MGLGPQDLSLGLCVVQREGEEVDLFEGLSLPVQQAALLGELGWDRQRGAGNQDEGRNQDRSKMTVHESPRSGAEASLARVLTSRAVILPANCPPRLHENTSPAP